MTDISAAPARQGLLLDRISHRYGATAVVDGVTLDIQPGELVALLGPSGCGKTTLLKIIAGFVRQTEGHVVVGGQMIDRLPPNRRRIGLVFQNYALFRASAANPSIDVMLHDPEPALLAIGQGLVEPYPVASSTHYKDLIPAAQQPMGPAGFFQVVGLTYNPETVKSPPTSWADHWRPELKGRVGLTNMNSTLGTGFMVEIAKIQGGSEKNIDPAFKQIAMLKPNVVAVAGNPGALAALFQQGQIDISPAISTPSRSSAPRACRWNSWRRRRARSPSRPRCTSRRIRRTRSWRSS